MSEIEQQFREELTEVISRYQSKIPKRRLISTVSSVLCKQLNIIKVSVKWKENPVIRGVGYAKGFPIIDELEGSLGRDAVAGIINNNCSHQMIAEADCDGDIRKCDRACFKGE